MADLSLYLLGPPRVKLDDDYIEVKPRKALALLIYLAVTAEPQARDSLATLLWPKSNQRLARRALSNRLSELKQILGDDWIDAGHQTISLRPGYWLDVGAFQEALAVEAGNPQILSDAADFYHDDFLSGFTLPDCPKYDEWQYFQTESLCQALGAALDRLVELLSDQGDYETAVPHARRRLTLDPLHEPACRQLMRLYALAGQQSAALRQYELCRQNLEEELGVEPAAETRDLYDRLLTEKESPALILSAVDDGTQKRAPRHNLPHQSTAFIGRERELAKVKELLDGTRLLTLVGPGGTGKTRLAQQAASEMVGAFKNGVYFVSLAPIESAELIVQTIAETIGFPFSSHEDPKRQLLRHLRHRHYLLVFDGFEHLLDGASLISEILHYAGQVKIVVTSREKLNLREETKLRIEGLAYPEALPATDELDYSAAQLFVERARHLRPDFTVGANDAPHVSHICRLLEGMPLGILLAATWVEMLTPEEIAAEINRSLDFLQAEWRDVPGRHLSVRAAFDPSWQRLTERQRELFAKLTIFSGGFTREAADIVAGASLQDLAIFVNKSLLRRDLAARDLATGRYEMHELLRQYAREYLETMPETREVVAQAHAIYFADLIQEQWLKLISSEQQVALAAIDADLENLRHSWRYWLKQRHAARITMYFNGFWRVYDLRGWYKTGMELFGDAVTTLRPMLKTGDEEVETAYANALAQQSFFMGYLGYTDEGLLQAQESVSILRRLRRFQELALPLAILKYNTYYIEDFEKAESLDIRDIEFTNDPEGQWERAWIETWQSRAAAWSGEYEQARQQIEQSLQIFEQLGDILATTWPRIELGNIAVVQGNFAKAQEYYEEVLRVSRTSSTSYWAIVKAGRYLGNIAAILDDCQEARNYLLASLQLADELGMVRDVVSALYDIAAIEATVGDKEAAVRWLVIVQQHPLSNQTRTFSAWVRDPVVRFPDLAELLLSQLQGEMPPDVYAAALAVGKTLELDTAVLELLATA